MKLCVALAIETPFSSLLMVTTTFVVASRAPLVGIDSVMLKVSGPSMRVSLTTCTYGAGTTLGPTAIVFVVSPIAKVMVPVVVV